MVININSDKNIIHFHSSGIGGVLKSFMYDGHKQIYSLYTNLNIDIKMRLENIHQAKEMYNSKYITMCKYIMMAKLNNLIPRIIKKDLLSEFLKVVVPTNFS